MPNLISGGWPTLSRLLAVRNRRSRRSAEPNADLKNLVDAFFLLFVL